MIIYTEDKLVVRELEDKDAKTLIKWLSDPKVLQYYEGRDRPHDLDLVRKHFYNRDRDVIGCIVEYEAIDIGYIQIYPIDEEEMTEYGFSGFSGKIYGTDQFIGEIEYWNRGIGTLLVQSMVNYLIHHVGVEKIVMDPQSWNERAISCYEKCGFRKIKLLPKHEWHEGEKRDCWLMEYSTGV